MFCLIGFSKFSNKYFYRKWSGQLKGQDFLYTDTNHHQGPGSRGLGEALRRVRWPWGLGGVDRSTAVNREENTASSESISVTGKGANLCVGQWKKLPPVNRNDVKCHRLYSQTLKHPSLPLLLLIWNTAVTPAVQEGSRPCPALSLSTSPCHFPHRSPLAPVPVPYYAALWDSTPPTLLRQFFLIIVSSDGILHRYQVWSNSLPFSGETNLLAKEEIQFELQPTPGHEII